MNLDPFSKSAPGSPSSFNPSAPNDIFVKSKIGGGLGRVSKPVEAAEEQDPAEPAAATEPEKPKVKTVLRNPKWESDKVGFNEEAIISVEVDLAPEHAHKTKVSFELFAKTPKGPESISKGEGTAEGGKARCKIPVYIPNFRDEDGNFLQKVEYYFIAKHSESDPLDGSKAPKLVDEMAERLIKTHILPDLTFGFDKSFLHPSQAQALKGMSTEIKTWLEENPEGKLAVFGHADAVGKEDYNKSLSERRAQSVLAFLLKDPKAWEDLSKEEKWGLGPIQDLLRHAGHDPGASDGKDGPKTQAAVKGFQADKGLAASGQADEKTRAALFQAFMEACETPALGAKDFDDVNGGPSAGCSEFNLVEKTDGPCAANRRVTVLLLKSNKNFPITYPCQKKDVGPCRKQVARKGERRTDGFGCFFYDKLVVERKIEPAPIGNLKFVGISGEEIKQYVNLPAKDKDNGFERLIEVEAENAADGFEVFWKVTAEANNSLRTEPKTGVKPKGDTGFIAFASGLAETTSKFMGGKASIILGCGLAGGDGFTIEAGISKDKMSLKATLRNWRKLHYEILAPDFMSFQECELSDGTKGMDFPPAMISRMKDRLAKAFIEYDLFKSHIFEEGSAPDGSVFKSEQLGLPAGGKGYVLTDHTFKSYPKKFDGGMAPRSIGLKLCNRNYYFESGSSPLISRTLTLNSETFKYEVFNWDLVYFLPLSAENGGNSIRTLTWKALVDPVKNPGHPGLLNGKPRQGSLDSNTIKLITTKEFEITLPKVGPSDPGSLAGTTVTEDRCPIEIKIKFEGAEEGLGLAGQGAQSGENLVVYNTSSPDSFVDVLLHELGHSMGQTVYSGIYLPPKGLSVPKQSSQDDSIYKHNGSNGHVYIGKGHSGSHCAYGLSDSDKASGNYGGMPGTCIMFGENSGSGASLALTGFCPQCTDYIKSRDLRDLSELLE